jgi:hypothetical protein
VGRRLDVDATADDLRAAVLELESSPEVAARCAALRTELRAAGGRQAQPMSSRPRLRVGDRARRAARRGRR